MSDRKEIEHMLETYCLEIHKRLNDFQCWESRIEDGLNDLPDIKAKANAYLGKVKKIIEDADFIKKSFKKAQLAYRVYERLMENEKSKAKLRIKKGDLLSSKIKILEKKVFKLEKSLNKPITQKDLSYGNSKTPPGTARPY